MVRKWILRINYTIMKKIYVLLLVLSTSLFFCQEKKVTKNGIINFEASVPSFEPVEAKHNSVSAILNTATGEIASLALVKGFRFKIALMEEHFNENYAESTKFPKATFKGTIQNFDITKLTTTPQNFNLKGILEFHGKTKEISPIVSIWKNGDKIELKSNFVLNSDDFDIKIPKIVSSKVSKQVNTQIHFIF